MADETDAVLRAISAAMDTQRVTQTELGRRLDISQSLVSLILAGKIRLTVDMLIVICRELHLSPASLVPAYSYHQQDKFPLAM